MNNSDSEVIDSSLAELGEMMAKDDYSLTWHLAGEREVVVQVEPGPNACADCLSPTPVMEAIIGEALSSTPYSLDRVILPNER